ncbi:MAG: hypothetical protein J6V38_02835 [Kiritimatiellae bacterium]|nr:hypothetical protein [Kiritimatiellia bacterium]
MKIKFSTFEELIVPPSKDNMHMLNMIALYTGLAADDLVELVENDKQLNEQDRKRVMLHISKLMLISDNIYITLDREGFYNGSN